MDTVVGNPRRTLSSRYGADRGHSGRTQWPVIPVVPCPGRYGADATSGRVSHPVALSHRPAEIAGVVEALMRHDELLGGSAETGGDGPWTSRPRATRRMRPRAIRRMRPLPRPSLDSLGRDGDGVPCRGPAPPTEAYPWEPRARRSLFRDLLLEARGEVEEGSVTGGGAHGLPSSFVLTFAWGTPF